MLTHLRPAVALTLFFTALTGLADVHLLEDRVRDEPLEPVGEDVLRDPEIRLEISEAPGAEERVAHDQERPPVAERFERLGDAAVHVLEALAGHRREHGKFGCIKQPK